MNSLTKFPRARQRQGRQPGEEESSGEYRGDLLDATVAVDLRRPAPAHQETKHEEQRCRRKAVVEHVEDRTCDRRRRQGENANDHKAEVTY